MVAVLQFIFSSFWVFLGFALLFSGAINGIVRIIKAFIPDKHFHITYGSLSEEDKMKFRTEYLKRVDNEQNKNYRQM